MHFFYINRVFQAKEAEHDIIIIDKQPLRRIGKAIKRQQRSCKLQDQVWELPTAGTKELRIKIS